MREGALVTDEAWRIEGRRRGERRLRVTGRRVNMILKGG